MNLFWRNRDVDLDPVEELERMQRELVRFFDPGRENAGLLDRSVVPAVDLIEGADGFTLYVDLPGVDKKDLELTFENGALTVKGDKKERKEQKGFFRKETWAGNFRRTIALPQSADGEKIQATLKDGILSVEIAKREELKPRQIAVNA